MYHSRARSAHLSRLRQRTVAGALIASLAAPVIALGSASPAFAAAGDLDTTFNTTGILEADLLNIRGVGGGCENCVDKGRAVAVQPDGKVVVVGEFGGDRAGWYALRRNADGTPDTTFSGDGLYTSPTTNGDALGVAVQSDGKIVVVGGLANGDFFAARLTTAGVLDPAFNGGAIKSIALGGSAGADMAFDVKIDSNGKIVLAGQVDAEIIQNEAPFFASNGPSSQVGVVRLNSDGSNDTSFGSGGIAVANGGDGNFLSGGVGIFGRGLALDSSNRPIVVGYLANQYSCCTPGETAIRVGVGVYRFGVNGSAPTVSDKYESQSTMTEAYDVTVQSTGRIVVAGTKNTGSSYDFAILGLDPTTFQPDTAFGSSGARTLDFAGDSDSALAVTVDSSDRIVAGGQTGANWDPAVARFTATGAVDTAFGTNGFRTNAIAGGVKARAYGVDVAPNGRIQALWQQLQELQASNSNPNSAPYRAKARDILTNVDFWLNENKLQASMGTRVHRVLDPVVN
ncbi:MAG: delta-60 repeat domain-containing protein [Acidimicrobiia bacterium]